MIAFLVFLLVVGFVVYMIQAAPFINGYFKMAVIGIICLITLIYLLNCLGLDTGVHFPIR